MIFSRDIAGGHNQVLLPLTPTVVDFADRMRDLVMVLADVEQRPELTIMQDLVGAGADIVRLWAVAPDSASTITLSRAATMCQEGLLLMTAAAQAELRPARAFPMGLARDMGLPKEVVEYIAALGFGRNEGDAFAVTISSAVAPALKSGAPDQSGTVTSRPDQPFSRRVVHRLDKPLTAVRGALADTVARREIEPFEAAVSMGVSADLCEALANLIERADGLRVTITWSVGRPGGQNAEHAFGHSDATVLHEAASILRQVIQSKSAAE